MCLIIFAHDAHPEFRLILAANRDEFHDRPTAPAGVWDDHPHVLAGRDLRGGGTWLGVTRNGWWAAVTNIRDGDEQRADAVSRGSLVADFLTGEPGAVEYARSLSGRLSDYNGFNLLVGDPEDTAWISNRAPSSAVAPALAPGVHGVSNHLLNTDWPKVARGKRELEALIRAGDDVTADHLLGMLLDRAYAADHDLPSTGVPLELERALSATFISTPDYGTRSSSALLIRRDGGIHFAERRYDAAGSAVGEERLEIAGF